MFQLTSSEFEFLKSQIVIIDDETCEILHISLSTLDTYVKKGAIPCSYLGTRVRFSQDDIYKAMVKNSTKKTQ